MSRTNIDWATKRWDPVTGCSKVSAGCKNCYAEREWIRLTAAPATRYTGRQFTDVQCHPDLLPRPLHWKLPSRVFVCPRGDLFHEDVPDDFIDQVFAVMALAPQHTFIVLTKRPERMREYLSDDITPYGIQETKQFLEAGYRVACDDDTARNAAWHAETARLEQGVDAVNAWQSSCTPLPNVHLGVSVEDQATADERIPLLLQTPAAVRWVSYEPALGPVDLYGGDPDPRLGGVVAGPGVSLEQYWKADGSGPFPGVDWVVAGGESGPRARPMHPDWMRSVRDQCAAARVPFFFKQWGEWAQVSLDNVDAAKAHHFLALDGTDETDRPINEYSDGVAHMGLVSKREAGHLLDGVAHRDYPTELAP